MFLRNSKHLRTARCRNPRQGRHLTYSRRANLNTYVNDPCYRQHVIAQTWTLTSTILVTDGTLLHKTEHLRQPSLLPTAHYCTNLNTYVNGPCYRRHVVASWRSCTVQTWTLTSTSVLPTARYRKLAVLYRANLNSYVNVRVTDGTLSQAGGPVPCKLTLCVLRRLPITAVYTAHRNAFCSEPIQSLSPIKKALHDFILSAKTYQSRPDFTEDFWAERSLCMFAAIDYSVPGIDGNGFDCATHCRCWSVLKCDTLRCYCRCWSVLKCDRLQMLKCT
jgi:hypothetical protein